MKLVDYREVLKAKRKYRGLSLNQASKKLGICQTAISSMERFRSHITIPNLVKMIKGYKVFPAELFYSNLDGRGAYVDEYDEYTKIRESFKGIDNQMYLCLGRAMGFSIDGLDIEYVFNHQEDLEYLLENMELLDKVCKQIVCYNSRLSVKIVAREKLWEY